MCVAFFKSEHTLLTLMLYDSSKIFLVMSTYFSDKNFPLVLDTVEEGKNA